MKKNPYAEQPWDLVPKVCAQALLQRTFLAAANSIPVLAPRYLAADIQLERELHPRDGVIDAMGFDSVS